MMGRGTTQKALWRVMTFFIAVLLGAPAHAALYVEIHGGTVQGLPIAIVPFEQPEAVSDDLEDIAAVIRADLGHSGQFATNHRAPLAGATFQGPVDRVAYKNLGIEALVRGRLFRTGGRYQVAFELLDVLGGGQAQHTPKTLLSRRFDGIATQHLRTLAHHISDLIFEKLIGVKGFFSTRIAYVSTVSGVKGLRYTLEVSDFDGAHPKPLYRSDYPLMSPAWSANGRHIAFVSFEKDRASIHVVDVLRGQVQKLTQFPGINGAPSWSPDGQSLALVLSKEGYPKIYTLHLANKHLQRVTEGSSRDTEPVFSPDGQWIYFTSDRGGKPQIYRTRLATGQTERVTFIGRYNAKPCLTPDGKHLVTLHQSESGNGLFSIAIQSLSTGTLRVLTPTGLNDSPTLAPNGMMVLYGSEAGGRGVLNAVSLDGGTKIVLPLQAGAVKDPAWAPFVPGAPMD